MATMHAELRRTELNMSDVRRRSYSLSAKNSVRIDNYAITRKLVYLFIYFLLMAITVKFTSKLKYPSARHTVEYCTRSTHSGCLPRRLRWTYIEYHMRHLLARHSNTVIKFKLFQLFRSFILKCKNELMRESRKRKLDNELRYSDEFIQFKDYWFWKIWSVFTFTRFECNQSRWVMPKSVKNISESTNYVSANPTN